MRLLQLGDRPGRHRWRATAVVVAGLGWTAGVGTAGAATEHVAAAATAGEELTVSGEFSATGIFEPTAECPAFHTVHTGEGSWTGLGDVTFVLDYCVVLGSGASSPLSGTAEITAAEGTLTATVEGSLAGVGGAEGYPADYTATITGGTGDYEAATGTLELAAMWDDPELPVRSMHGTVSGTVELPAPTLPHPSSIGDCIHGGWRDFADDDGDPFHGTWDCIIYVITHRP
jgi:hypothetical protein